MRWFVLLLPLLALGCDPDPDCPDGEVSEDDVCMPICADDETYDAESDSCIAADEGDGTEGTTEE